MSFEVPTMPSDEMTAQSIVEQFSSENINRVVVYGTVPDPTSDQGFVITYPLMAIGQTFGEYVEEHNIPRDKVTMHILSKVEYGALTGEELLVSDDDDETDTSNESEDETEEEKSPKSQDGRDKEDDKNDDDDRHDGGSSSAAASMSPLDKMIEKMEGLKIEAEKAMEDYLNVKKVVANLKREEKKEANKLLQMEKRQTQKEEKAKARAMTININFIMGEKRFVIAFAKDTTIKDVRDKVRDHIGTITKKQFKTYRFLKGDVELSSHRKTVAGYELTDGSIINIQGAISGGGKRVKKEQTTNEMIDFDITPPAIFAGDIRVVQSALKLGEVSIEPWVQSLTLEQSSSLVKQMDEQPKTGVVGTLVEPYLQFVREYADLMVGDLVN